MSSLLSNESIVKASIAASTAIALDKFYFKSTSLKNSMLLGACVGGSSFIVSSLVKKNLIPDLSNGSMDTSLYSVKTVESRILELGLASSSAYVINTMVLKNMKPISLMEITILFLGSSGVAEYATDYLFNRNLSYLI